MKDVSSEVLLLCTVIILYVSVLKPCRWVCRSSSLVVSPCRRTCSTIVLCISSGTNDLWPPSPSFFFSPPIPLCLGLPGFISKTHNHLCSCSYHPEILTCVSSVLLLNDHSWMTVCCLCSFCDSWGSYVCVCVFWMRTWLNLCKMMEFV